MQVLLFYFDFISDVSVIIQSYPDNMGLFWFTIASTYLSQVLYACLGFGCYKVIDSFGSPWTNAWHSLSMLQPLFGLFNMVRHGKMASAAKEHFGGGMRRAANNYPAAIVLLTIYLNLDKPANPELALTVRVRSCASGPAMANSKRVRCPYALPSPHFSVPNGVISFGSCSRHSSVYENAFLKNPLWRFSHFDAVHRCGVCK